jgi:hypothetical protein
MVPRKGWSQVELAIYHLYIGKPVPKYIPCAHVCEGVLWLGHSSHALFLTSIAKLGNCPLVIYSVSLS